MKRLTFTLTLIIISLLAYAQPYIQTHANNIGFGAGVGFVAPNSGLQISTAFMIPPSDPEKPRIIDCSIGKRFWLSNKEQDNYNLTVAAGVADYRRTIYKDYMVGGLSKEVHTTSPIYTLEVGKDLYLGRISLYGSYCNRTYGGATIRVFFK